MGDGAIPWGAKLRDKESRWGRAAYDTKTGPTEADDLTRCKETPKPISIYTPEEMAKLLKHADDDIIPFLAIGAFAGLRHAEILRLAQLRGFACFPDKRWHS